MPPPDLLYRALCDPAGVTSLDAAAWNLLVRQARSARVLGRLGELLAERDLLEDVPKRAERHLASARIVADKHRRVMVWEIDRLDRVLRPLGVPVVLLKGAAYVAAGLPPARGRLYNDVDIMVPKAELARVEQALAEAGWLALKLHAYDQRYYRTWMHELPPLIHRTRRTILDLHHTILPETGRLHPPPERLFAAAQPAPGCSLQMLAPADMVLHSAAHLFQDGDLAGGLRDLTDLDDLFRHFGYEETFWEQLVPRAVQIDLARPLHYALRYCSRLLGTPIPADVLTAAQTAAPGPIRQSFMDRLVCRAVRPAHPDHHRRLDGAARWFLYVRSHWLRMPPRLLAAHLLRKAFRSWYEKDEEEGQ